MLKLIWSSQNYNVLCEKFFFLHLLNITFKVFKSILKLLCIVTMSVVCLVNVNSSMLHGQINSCLFVRKSLLSAPGLS